MSLRLLWGLAILIRSAQALSGEWLIDPRHSTLGFVATWEGAEFQGVFRRFHARIRFDPDHPAVGRFEVKIDVTSADANSAELNEGMARPEWFFFRKYPRATFVTSGIRPLGQGRYEAQGMLSLKGVERPIRLLFSWRADHSKARMQAQATLRRTDFGIGEEDWGDGDVIGVDVKVVADLRLRARSK